MSNVAVIEQPQTEQAPRLPALQAGGAVRAIVPQDFDGAWRIANAVCKAGMAPKGLDKPEQAMVAIMHGLEIGLTPANCYEHAANWLVQIDCEAVAAGQRFRAQHPDASEVRRRAALGGWLGAINKLHADLLDMPDVRMTGAGLLYQAAHSDGTRQFFVSQYQELLAAHLAAEPQLQAAE